MKGIAFLSYVMLWLAAIGMSCPHLALAVQSESKPKPPVSDLKLHEGGVLVGQVVNAESHGLQNTKVTLSSGEKLLVGAKTDKNGFFAFSGLQHNGVYRIAAEKGHGTYRVWTARTAPPSAQPGALIVAGNQTVRGQNGMRGFRNLMANPWFIGAIIAAAIAIPVALHNSRRGPTSP